MKIGSPQQRKYAGHLADEHDLVLDDFLSLSVQFHLFFVNGSDSGFIGTEFLLVCLVEFLFRAAVEDSDKHVVDCKRQGNEISRRRAMPGTLLTFFANEGQTPREDVHEIGQPVRMRCTVELTDAGNKRVSIPRRKARKATAKTKICSLHDVGFIFENGSLVPVNVKVIGSTEDSHDRWKSGGFGFAVHSVPRKVCSS